MKKIIFAFAAGCALALGGIQEAYSQTAALLSGSVLLNVGRVGYVNSKAVRDFSNTYKGISDAQWSSLKQGGFMCQFTDEMVVTRVFYNKNGNWLYTISGYGGDKLAKDKRDIVRSIYYDYDITYVNEIDLPGIKKVYLIQVQDEKRLQIVRMCNDEMETIQELEKL